MPPPLGPRITIGTRRAPAIPALGGEVGDLVEAAGDEVGELHLGDGPHAHQRRADRGADDAGLGDRRVHDALLAELFEHAVGDLECAAVDADVFAEDEHAFVALHLFPDSLADRFNVGGEGHGLLDSLVDTVVRQSSGSG